MTQPLYRVRIGSDALPYTATLYAADAEIALCKALGRTPSRLDRETATVEERQPDGAWRLVLSRDERGNLSRLHMVQPGHYRAA